MQLCIWTTQLEEHSYQFPQRKRAKTKPVGKLRVLRDYLFCPHQSIEVFTGITSECAGYSESVKAISFDVGTSRLPVIVSSC